MKEDRDRITRRSGRKPVSCLGGFTLIELLIVIAIILILIAIALPNFLEAQLRARLTNTRACLRTYQTANEAYYTDYGIHAPDVDGGQRSIDTRRSWSTIIGMHYGVRCDGSEICTYLLFTTPIPYIRDLCFDPFLEQRNDPVAGKTYTLPEYSSYLSGDPQRKIWAEQFGLRYAFLSRGPDLDRDAGDYNAMWRDLGSHTHPHYTGSHTHHITQIPAIYAPTNGSKSNGDLVVTNRGQEGP